MLRERAPVLVIVENQVIHALLPAASPGGAKRPPRRSTADAPNRFEASEIALSAQLLRDFPKRSRTVCRLSDRGMQLL